MYLFSDLGSPFGNDQLEAIMDGLKEMEIHLTLMWVLIILTCRFIGVHCSQEYDYEVLQLITKPCWAPSWKSWFASKSSFGNMLCCNGEILLIDSSYT